MPALTLATVQLLTEEMGSCSANEGIAMNINHILLYVHEGAEPAIDVAIQLAKETDAKVTALHVIPYIQSSVSRIYVPDPTSIREQRQEARDRGISLQKVVEAQADAGDVALEFIITEGQVFDEIVRTAMYSDVTVINKSARHVTIELINDLLVHSGHPVVVVPDNMATANLGRHIVVGWKASPHAVRAVFAATELLRNASKVTIVEAWRAEPEAFQKTGQRLREHLATHGVQAETRSVDCDSEYEGLISACREVNADLLVVGASSHSRAREWIFGGMTHRLLDNVPLPLLLMN